MRLKFQLPYTGFNPFRVGFRCGANPGQLVPRNPGLNDGIPSGFTVPQSVLFVFIRGQILVPIQIFSFQHRFAAGGKFGEGVKNRIG